MKFDEVAQSTTLPVLAAPLFLISNPDLVVAQCRAGVVGSFPALNARTTQELDAWLVAILGALTSDNPPFAVNLIVHRSNERLKGDLEVCVRHHVPIVITSLGVQPEVIKAVHSYGGLVLHDVINDRFSRKAVCAGADGLIAVGAGAGGHAGAQSPFALVQDIRSWFDGPLLLAGAIAHGRSILAAQVAGANMAYIGSPFIATQEAPATMPYKQMLIDSSASDIVYTSALTGIPGNFLRGSLTAAGIDPDTLSDAEPVSLSTDSMGNSGPKPWRDLWGSGQGVGLTKHVSPVEDLVAGWRAEYTEAQRIFRTMNEESRNEYW
ncbi:nitronate monooxygenase family protein [Gordonia malaquae]|uniref:NAD(P)H-dependent flavin oxidoreductase n=1 Tax=Gordonia malaquae TaxID=410332 RepID=UPI0030FF254D